ncbi:MAG TPA: hypothetical protein PKA33_20335 [Amaricoccus sp.]|uniref:hypothetical protein n=1 Tax=Amaricoccus sp. TaxID=1872485 RepID=UPI002CF8F1F1|nr:hypothetical protein [Amaricoccus sp.]HMQ94375.1 hypothetical protein [Amaricoccus sp.]HMR54639.1 hypothetical protein [Amaricoccus sp.]HMU01682.1 hypothetical protein [Amaricoccus sp.]
MGFGLLYLAALGLFLVGTFGLFGSERGPLAGVFLVPLGLPWTRLLDGVAQPLLPWLAALSPLVNLAILVAICRLATAKRR